MSRADDPQLHTHVVISSKVQTADGRWLALDALALKKHQQAFGYLYQSVLRAEVTARFGMVFDPIVNGQAEIAGLPDGILEQFSKRPDQIGVEMGDKLADFHTREGRDPTSFEYAAMEREAAVDTRNRKTGLGVTDLRTRWRAEARSVGVDPATVLESAVAYAHQHPQQPSPVAAGEVVEALAARQSAWNRLEVLRQLCDTVSPQPGHDATTWATALDAAVDTVLAECVDLDPTGTAAHRRSDGRSVWIEPIAKQSTSAHVLAQEEHIITFALDAQTPEPSPSATIVVGRLDDAQRTAASAVAGHDRLVVVVGPAGAGTRPPCATSPGGSLRGVAMEAMVDTISPPFSDAANLRRCLAEKHYSRDPSEAVAHMVAFYGVSSFEELMAVPARKNSGALGTLATCWFGLFPFVGPADQWVEVDDIGITNDGYTILFWGRWNGECSGPTTLPSGESIDLTGKSYRDLRYAYRLSFSPDTKKAVLFEGLFDTAEWGRLMDSPEFARAAGQNSLYPT